MFCPKCGADNPQGSRFCQRCGAAIPIAPGASFRIPQIVLRGSAQPVWLVPAIAVAGLVLLVVMFNVVRSVVGGIGGSSAGIAGGPPGVGAYLRSGLFGLGYERMQQKMRGNEWPFSEDGLPATSSARPEIVIWEPTIDLTYLNLWQAVGGGGVTIDFRTLAVSNVSVVGRRNGFAVGDRIVSVGGVKVQGQEVTQYLRGPVGTSTSVVVVREGRTVDLAVRRRMIEEGESVPFVTETRGNQYILRPSLSLPSGMYCFTAGNPQISMYALPSWCFIVR